MKTSIPQPVLGDIIDKAHERLAQWRILTAERLRAEDGASVARSRENDSFKYLQEVLTFIEEQNEGNSNLFESWDVPRPKKDKP